MVSSATLATGAERTATRSAASADLPNAILRNAKLDDADLYEIVLQGADLAHASLDRAELNSANLQHTDLCQARLGESRAFSQGANARRAYKDVPVRR